LKRNEIISNADFEIIREELRGKHLIK
jgi:hypothetical protein